MRNLAFKVALVLAQVTLFFISLKLAEALFVRLAAAFRLRNAWTLIDLPIIYRDLPTSTLTEESNL